MSNATRPREFTGWHMLVSIVLFFGVVIAVNVFMAVSAARTWTGLVVENSYVASQEFNTKLGNARMQAALGWQGGLQYADGRLIFSLVDADGQPLAASTVTIAMSRPIGVEGDQTLNLRQADDGTYQSPVTLESGVWNAAIVAGFQDGPDYEHHARLLVGLSP